MSPVKGVIQVSKVTRRYCARLPRERLLTSELGVCRPPQLEASGTVLRGEVGPPSSRPLRPRPALLPGDRVPDERAPRGPRPGGRRASPPPTTTSPRPRPCPVEGRLSIGEHQHGRQRRDERPGVEARLGPAQVQARQLALGFGDPRQRRHGGGDSFEQVGALLLGQFVALPVRQHGARGGRGHVAEHVRVAAHELVVHVPSDVCQVEQALLLRKRRVEQHLAEQVPELFAHVIARRGGGAGRILTQELDRLHRLVGLLQQVPHQRVVRLGTIPRAPLAKHPHELGQARSAPAEWAR